MTTTAPRSPLVRSLIEVDGLMRTGTTEDKIAWASKTWRETVAQARETNAAKAAAPAPWTPRNLHGTAR